MTMTLTPTLATLEGIIGVEEADTLREWCTTAERRAVDLSGCTHLHAASLQVLMAATVTVVQFPQDAPLSTWLRRVSPPFIISDI